MKKVDFVADLMRQTPNPSQKQYRQVMAKVMACFGMTNKQVYKLFDETRRWRKDVADWHVDFSMVQDQKPFNVPDQKCELSIGGDEAHIVTDGAKVKTVEDAIAYSEMDMTVWETTSSVVNFWDVTNSEGLTFTNYQIKVWFKRRVVTFIEAGLIELVEELKHRFKWGEVKKIKVPKDLLLEICLFDAHFGKLAWKPETGDSYDIKRAVALYESAPEEILSLVGGAGVGQILLPIGSDFFHINNSEGTTAKGTSLDVDSRFKKIFKAGCECVARVVEKLSRFAPVKVCWVPGNHDRETSFFLVMFLSALFENNPNVEIDIGEKDRKYVSWGKVLIGYTHGSEEKKDSLPLLMASEEPLLWAGSVRREWHIGHLHKRKEMSYLPLDTFGGVVVRTIPSLCGTDSWHFSKGYVNSGRVAQAFLWHRSGSLVSMIETPIEMPDWIEDKI